MNLPLRGTRPAAAALALAAAVLSTSAANAAIVQYHFTTNANPFGSVGPMAAFDPTWSVQGRFDYDNSVPASLVDGIGATIYAGAMFNLSATVGPYSFSDTRGYVSAGDEALPAGLDPLDIMTVGADPRTGTTPNPLQGFAIPGYTLVNFRLLWLEGQLGIGDFLNDENLPAGLPGFGGRLALDFRPDAGGAQQFVFFDGARVEAVPEPASTLLLLTGLAALALRRRTDTAVG